MMIKHFWTLLLALVFSACSADAPFQQNVPDPQASIPGEEAANLSSRPGLPSLGPAPELAGETWLNTDQPLRLKDLRGKVVLLEMWTFG
jgi:hypothetical protein